MTVNNIFESSKCHIIFVDQNKLFMQLFTNYYDTKSNYSCGNLRITMILIIA